MSTPLRLATFAAGVVVVFLLAFGVGQALGPWSSQTPEPARTPAPTHGESHSDSQAPHDQTRTEAPDVD
ncbi:hypothetical protein [Nocardioides gilvus]|uniref:hypothetical protein n=1 Tax=Nocardioides gilvus TaxID=1735589 RepID=UPI000D74EC96|nr:hypothetical protein [Nocardioides gilvus]